MLFFLVHAVIELKHNATVFVSAFVKPLFWRLNLDFKNFLNVLDVVQQDLLRFLLSARARVYIIDLFKVVTLICKKLFGYLIGVLKRAVLAIVLRLVVQVVKKLNQTFMELRNFNVWRHTLNLSLENRNLSVLLSKQLLLAYDLFVFSIVLSFNFLYDLRLLFGFHVLLPLLNALLFLFELFLLLFAVFLKLDLSLCKTSLFFNQACYDIDFCLLNSWLWNLRL